MIPSNMQYIVGRLHSGEYIIGLQNKGNERRIVGALELKIPTNKKLDIKSLDPTSKNAIIQFSSLNFFRWHHNEVTDKVIKLYNAYCLKVGIDLEDL